MKKIAILGSTGSIGTQTLEIVRNNEDLKVVAMAAGRNVELMEKQVREFRPDLLIWIINCPDCSHRISFWLRQDLPWVRRRLF